MLKGKFEHEERLQHGLASKYLQFLQNIEHIENWEDVEPLGDPIVLEKEVRCIDDELIQKLQKISPVLGESCRSLQFGNLLSTRLGIRYAYSRLHIHSHLLSAVDDVLSAILDRTSSIVEVGCFNGGLLHFVAQHYSPIQTVGVDLSPVALDLASDLSKCLKIDPMTLWLETDFALIEKDKLSEELKPFFLRPLIVLSNVIVDIGNELGRSPAVDELHAQAGLISYWVNQGAVVLVCQRNDTPEEYLQALINNGRWEGDDCLAIPLEYFDCWSTEHMDKDNPLGEWIHCKAGTFLFYNRKCWSELNEYLNLD